MLLGCSVAYLKSALESVQEPHEAFLSGLIGLDLENLPELRLRQPLQGLNLQGVSFVAISYGAEDQQVMLLQEALEGVEGCHLAHLLLIVFVVDRRLVVA